MREEIMRALGRIEGKIEGLDTKVDSIEGKQDKFDERLRHVEIRSTLNGAMAGSVMGVGVSLMVAGIKEAFKSGGGMS